MTVIQTYGRTDKAIFCGGRFTSEKLKIRIICIYNNVYVCTYAGSVQMYVYMYISLFDIVRLQKLCKTFFFVVGCTNVLQCKA